MFEREEP